MIASTFKDDFIRLLKPLTSLFVRVGLHPDILTFLGLLLNLAAAVIFAKGWFHVAGLVMLLGGLFDVLDGEVARASHKGSKFGALLDSTLDRYSEIFVSFGIAVYYIGMLIRTHSVLSIAALTALFFALAGSLMVSYVRARAEGLGEECKVGIMQRPERIIIIVTGALLSVLGKIFLIIALWLVAFFANFTVIERIWYIWKKTRSLRLDQTS